MAVNIFVSYSQENHYAATLIGTLRRNPDLRLFIAHQFPAPGMSIKAKIHQALQPCDLVLLLWSGDAEASEWVDYEIRTAMQMGKRVLPLLLEDVSLPDFLSDIEGLPLHKDPERGMTWLYHQLPQLAAPRSSRGLGVGTLSWRKLMAAGLAIGGVLAAASNTDSTPTKKRPARAD